MKKTILTSLAISGFALGAFAQGGLVLDNNAAAHGIVTGPGQFYAGTAGIEAWFKNGNSFDLNLINGVTNSAAYDPLAANGFTLATHINGAAVSGGGFALNQLNIPGVSPAASTITLVIVAWQGSGTSFAGNGGVLAFYQPTVDYTIVPAPLAPDLTGATGGFNTTDLLLSPIAPVPEPSSFALAGLGAAAMLIFRRRK